MQEQSKPRMGRRHDILFAGGEVVRVYGKVAGRGKAMQEDRIFAGEQKTVWEGGERQKDEKVIGGQGLAG